MASVFCGGCGASVDAADSFCTACGKPMPKPDAVAAGRLKKAFDTIGAESKDAPVRRVRNTVTNWVTPVNAVFVFLTSTSVLAGDFFSPMVKSLDKVAVLLGFLLIAYLAARHWLAPVLQSTSQTNRKLLALLAPDKPLAKTSTFLCLLFAVFLSVAGMAWSNATADSGGALASSVPGASKLQSEMGLLTELRAGQQIQTSILTDIRDGRSEDPATRLRNRGYMPNPMMVSMAVGNVDVAAMNDFVKLDMRLDPKMDLATMRVGFVGPAGAMTDWFESKHRVKERGEVLEAFVKLGAGPDFMFFPTELRTDAAPSPATPIRYKALKVTKNGLIQVTPNAMPGTTSIRISMLLAAHLAEQPQLIAALKRADASEAVGLEVTMYPPSSVVPCKYPPGGRCLRENEQESRGVHVKMSVPEVLAAIR